MIISIRDSKKYSSNAAGLTAILASMTAIAKSKKTLIIQLTPSDEESILNFLYGKALSERSLNAMYHLYEDDGLDALFIRAETMELNVEHFDECVTGLFEKKNLLDILKPTKQVDYKKIIEISKIGDILKSAHDVYDFIYIYMPMDDEEIIEAVTKQTDDNLVCVYQNTKVVPLKETETPVVVNFESGSKFDKKYLKKNYNRKKIYFVPHNVEYKDAMISKTVLDFMLRNKKDMKEDVNYTFVSSLYELLAGYISDEKKEEEDTILVGKEEKKELVVTVDQLRTIPGECIQEVTVKKGLFRKKNKMMMNMGEE